MKLLIVFSLTLVGLKTRAQDTTQASLSLEECIQIALQNNPDVQESGIATSRAKVSWRQSKENMLPSISAGISHGIDNGKSIDPYTNTYITQQNSQASYNLSGSFLLFNGFAYLHKLKQEKYNYQAAKMDEQDQKDQIVLNVMLAYLQVLTNRDILKQAMQQQEVSGRQVERLRQMNQNGAISPSELYDLKGQYANDQIAVINSQNNLANAKLSLAQLMNVPNDTTTQIAPIATTEFLMNYDATADDIYIHALTHLASVKAAELHKKSADMAIKSFRSSYFPSLSFNSYLATNYSSAAAIQEYVNQQEVNTGNYVRFNGDQLPVYTLEKNYASHKIDYRHQLKDNIYSSFSLSLQIPILNGLRTRNNVFLAKLDYKQAQVIEQTTKIRLKQSIDQAYLNMIAAKRKYAALSQQVKDFAESFRSADVKFNEGAINSVDYLVAKKNLDDANINLIEAGYDYVFRKKILDYYRGETTASSQ